MAENGRIFYWKFANPQSFFDLSGGGDIWFFHFPFSAVNFECQLLSVEPDHDYEIEKLCKGFF